MTKSIVCPDCDGRGFIPHCETYEYGDGLGGGRAWSETCGRCNGAGNIKVPMTNADRIRSMTDEELAVFLTGSNSSYTRFNSPKNILEWLQRTIEED